MKRLIEPLLWGVAAAALLYGAYAIGQHSERKWWRAEIAAKSARVKVLLERSGAEAEDTDQKLIAALGDTHDELRRAEDALAAALQRDPPRPAATSPEVAEAAPVAALDPCRPIPAQCLRAGR